MSQYKFVIGVTGSISAYKSCDLISQLVKQGHSVKVIMSQNAKKFIGEATLATLSQNPVFTDDFTNPQQMTHLELGRWCDAAFFYPASAQTINSFATGVGHELHNSFFLAYDFAKPFFIAPAMNTRMLSNPVTKKSLKFLTEIGCQILPTEVGELACKEVGEGRLLAPDKAIATILSRLSQTKQRAKRVLITAGGTRETIDGVRTLTNMSTGRTGADLADFLHENGFQVLLLTSRFALMPKSKVKVDTYESFREIYNSLKALGKSHEFDMILHSAAISDYSIENIQTPDGKVIPSQGKLSSQYDNISIQLKRNEKILPRLKDLFTNEPVVVGFKLTSTESKEEQAKAIFGLFTEKSVDYVVHNDMNDINQGKRKFLITSKEGRQNHFQTTQELSQHIANLLDGTNSEVANDLSS